MPRGHYGTKRARVGAEPQKGGVFDFSDLPDAPATSPQKGGVFDFSDLPDAPTAPPSKAPLSLDVDSMTITPAPPPVPKSASPAPAPSPVPASAPSLAPRAADRETWSSLQVGLAITIAAVGALAVGALAARMGD